MKADATKTIEVNLTLDGTEARWLMSVMQNPLHGLSMTQEHENDRGMREKFFKGLKTAIDRTRD